MIIPALQSIRRRCPSRPNRSAAINSGIIIDSIRVRVPSLIVCIFVSLRSLKDVSPGDTLFLRAHDKRHCEWQEGNWKRFPTLDLFGCVSLDIVDGSVLWAVEFKNSYCFHLQQYLNLAELPIHCPTPDPHLVV